MTPRLHDVTRVDRRDRPAYPLTEAARYVRLPRTTLSAWVRGRAYPLRRDGKPARFEPLIRAADGRRHVLSFNNLIEAHVLRALRTEHGVSIDAVREALRTAEAGYDISRLLLHEDLLAGAGDLFLERYGQLVSLSRSGQLAMRKVLEAHLRRVERVDTFPIRLYPFVPLDDVVGERPVAIDPAIAFGRPVVLRTGVSTAAIAGRIDAGESVDEVAADYGMQPAEVEGAVLYERAA